MKIYKALVFVIVAAFIFSIYQNITAFENGIVGFTKKNGEMVGCVCHQFEPNLKVSVNISGPSAVNVNDTATYYLKISGGPAVLGGCDIATSLGQVITSPLDNTLKREEPFTNAGFELTHISPQSFVNDTLTFIFQYIAPDKPFLIDTIFANGNSVNGDTTSENDIWNYAENFIVNITPSSIISQSSAIPGDFVLSQNYPNPFNPETKINFTLPKTSDVTLYVYNSAGKEISRLIVNERLSQGQYSVSFNSSEYGLTSGVYFYRITASDFSQTRSMVLIK
ncbi:MAG TPA: T9SS type A sorting domain-containing protein [Ignavibacteria bacterium]|nr:T9SS type A sorting domain-containing protein [Ignavibacteria bacterium]